MAFEYHLVFSDQAWLKAGWGRIEELAKSSPSFVQQPNDREIWLKAPDSQNRWEYDVRVIRHDDAHVIVEVSAFTSAFWRDVRTLIEAVQSVTPVTLADDDGEPYIFAPPG